MLRHVVVTVSLVGLGAMGALLTKSEIASAQQPASACSVPPTSGDYQSIVATPGGVMAVFEDSNNNVWMYRIVGIDAKSPCLMVGVIERRAPK